MATHNSDPLDTFAQMTVYVQFDSDRPSRRPVQRVIPGHVGQWVCAYSSFDRLAKGNHGDEVEYSLLPGERLLENLPSGAGMWLDRGFPEGRQILLPSPDPAHDVG